MVRQVAAKMNAPLWGIESFIPTAKGKTLGLRGTHQVVNAAVALATIERLRDAGLTVPDTAITRGLAETRWPARVELITSEPTIILDTAHNLPSAEALVQTLRELLPSVFGSKHVVFAVSSDKQYPEMLRVLAGYFDHFHLTRYGNNPRSVLPERLVAILAEIAPGQVGYHA